MQTQEVTDEKIWEKFIQDHGPHCLFQSWVWGETISVPKWKLGFYDEKELVGIALVTRIQAKRGKFLHVRHGPILKKWTSSLLTKTIEFLKTLAKDQHCAFIRISPLLDNSGDNQKLFQNHGFRNAPTHSVDAELCWVLDLNTSEEELLKGMRKTTRYLIRQAEKIGVNIAVSKNENDLEEFFHLYAKTASRHGFVRHSGVVEEFREFLKRDSILLYKGFYENKLLAAALILFYNDQAIYHHSASIDQKVPVNYLLQWEVIKEARRRGMKYYNFWGIAPEGRPKHPWNGLSLFKKGFGGRAVAYLHAQDLPLSSAYYKTFLIEKTRTWWRGY